MIIDIYKPLCAYIIMKDYFGGANGRIYRSSTSTRTYRQNQICYNTKEVKNTKRLFGNSKETKYNGGINGRRKTRNTIRFS